MRRNIVLLLIALTVAMSGSAKQRRKTEPQPSFDQLPFDISRENLPPNYLGHYFPAIFAAAARRQAVSRKNEYETTGNYENRLAHLNSLPLMGSLRVDSLLAFVVGSVNQNYDADRRTLNLSLTLTSDIKWLHTEKLIGSYIGRNVFNRGVRVKAYRYDDYLLVIEGSSYPPDTLSASIMMEAVDAQQIKPRIRAVLLCYSLIGASSDQDHSAPTIDEPYDEYTFTYKLNVKPVQLWFVDSSNGAVLAKIGLDNKQIVKKLAPVPKPLGPPTKCPPAIIEQPEPHYTEEARAHQVTGTVTLSALFKETGDVTDVTIINPLPDGLTEKAIESAKGIKFLSPIVNGKKIQCRMSLDFNFNLY